MTEKKEIKEVKDIGEELKEKVYSEFEEHNPESPNIIITTEGKKVKIIFNKDKIVNTFSNREAISIGLHKKIEQFLQIFLDEQAKKEDLLRSGI